MSGPRVAFIQNCPVEGPGRYAEALVESGVELRVVRADRGEALPDVAEVDGVISGGTPTPAATLIERREPLVAWMERIAQAAVPCLAVCCSAQILGHLAGGALRRLGAMEIGVAQLEVTRAGHLDPVLGGFPPRFPAFQWHADYVETPATGELLVNGEVCPVQMFRVGTTLGTLFHFEVDAAGAASWCDAYAEQIPGPRRDLLATVGHAERTLRALADRLVENWVRSDVLGAPRSD